MMSLQLFASNFGLDSKSTQSRRRCPAIRNSLQVLLLMINAYRTKYLRARLMPRCK